MPLTTELFGNVLVVHTPEELTEAAAGEFLTELGQEIEAGRARVVLEMDRTETYDSAGLSVLLDLQDKARGVAGGVKVSGLTETGRKIFEVTRLDRRFDLFESLIDAVSSFR